MSVMEISRPLSHHCLTKDAQIKIFFHTSPRFFSVNAFFGLNRHDRLSVPVFIFLLLIRVRYNIQDNYF